jgi:signal transduction histidine kinase
MTGSACEFGRRWRWLAVLLLVCLAGPAPALELTAEERAWLAAHDPVVVGVGPPSPHPLAYYTVQLPPGGRGDPIVTGHAADLMALIADRVGMRIRYVSVPDIPTGLTMMVTGRIHMTPVLRMTPARRLLFSMPEALVSAELVWVVRSNAPPVDVLQKDARLRAVVTLGTPVETAMRDAFPLAQITGVPAESAGVPMVADGRADIALVDVNSAIQAIERGRLPGLQIRRTPTLPPFEAGPAVGIQYPLLHSIVAKALATVTPAERTLLRRRWLPQPVGATFDIQTAVLSADERAWVERQPKLRVGFDAALPPLSMAGSKDAASAAGSDFSGLAADVLRLAADKTGLRLDEVQGVVADQLPSLASAGGIDIAVGLTPTAQNRDDFLLVGPYLRASTVIVSPVSSPQTVTELRDLAPGVLAVMRSEPLLDELVSRHPAQSLLHFDHLSEALEAVARGQATAAVGNAFTVNHLIQQRYAGRLQVTGAVREGEIAYYFGVPRSKPELARVLALGFEALTPSDMAALRQRWLLVRIDNGLKWAVVLRWALPIAAAMLAVLVVLVLANRRLRAARLAADEARHAADLARAEAEAANAARGRFLAYLAHEVRGLVDSIGWGARLMLAEHPQASSEQVAGWIKSSADSTGRLLESTLENERALAHGVTLAPAEHDLQAWWQATLAPHEMTAASKGLVLRVQAPQAGAALCFDATRLSQLVHNLVGNAIKFTAQGEVLVRGHWDPARAQLQVDVLDSGPGIAAADAERLWEPYTQGAAGALARSGAGLGLAITRQIVTAMGGTVQAAPRPEGGSRFWFVVPLETAA